MIDTDDMTDSFLDALNKQDSMTTESVDMEEKTEPKFNYNTERSSAIDFGDYVVIEQHRFGASNEWYLHKVIGSSRSVTYVDVPVTGVRKEKIHIHKDLVDVVSCIICGLDETQVFKYRVQDVQSNPHDANNDRAESDKLGFPYQIGPEYDDPDRINADDANKGNELAISLLNEVISSHRDPEDFDYNECDKPGEECVWCADAKKAIASLNRKEQVIIP